MLTDRLKTLVLLSCLVFGGQVVFAENVIGGSDASTLRFGRQFGWKDFNQVSGIGFQKTKEGFLEMTLGAAQYVADENTDLLLHFDHGQIRDEASRYVGSAPAGVISRDFAALGDGSAVFRGDSTPMVVQSAGQGLFSSGQVWRDFSIEFWLYPSEAQDGETFFSWRGNRVSTGSFEAQAILASFRNSRLVWTFQNVFARTPAEKALTIVVTGSRTLIPRQWHHHMIHFQARTGLLEYLLDGQSEALTYATPSRSEESRVFGIALGPTKGEVVLGERFYGAIDELRVSREFIEQPQMDRYSPSSQPVASPTGAETAPKGVAVSRIFDLNQPGSTLDTIVVRSNREGESQAVFSYRMADSIRYQWTLGGETRRSLAASDLTEEDSWHRFVPGKPLYVAKISSTGQKPPAGRYLQLRVDLLPSGTGTDTPRISEIIVNFVSNVPPPAPAGLELIPGDGQLEIRWKPVTQGQVDGYLLFFGTRPGQYFGTKSGNGGSPLDVGNVTKVVLTGLLNDQIYYVAVASYQSIAQQGGPTTVTPIKNLSINSREFSARPQRSLP